MKLRPIGTGYRYFTTIIISMRVVYTGHREYYFHPDRSRCVVNDFGYIFIQILSGKQPRSPGVHKSTEPVASGRNAVRAPDLIVLVKFHVSPIVCKWTTGTRRISYRDSVDTRTIKKNKKLIHFEFANRSSVCRSVPRDEDDDDVKFSSP